MKSHRAIALCLLLAPAIAAAQNVQVEPENDPVLDAIQKFKKRDKNKPNEVTVVLFDKDAEEKAVAEAKPEEAAASDEPVLVSAVPAEPEKASGEAEDAAAQVAPEPVQDAPAEPEEGLAVRVESLQSGNAKVDPAQVKLLAPFPAKPLAEPPAGWHLDASDSAPPFTREVEISPGTRVTLNIRPHLLVPDADGVEAFGVPEPGYDTSLGYRQTATVGAILATSIRQMDEESRQLGDAIDRLNQLLVTLPVPEPAPKTTSKR